MKHYINQAVGSQTKGRNRRRKSRLWLLIATLAVMLGIRCLVPSGEKNIPEKVKIPPVTTGQNPDSPAEPPWNAGSAEAKIRAFAEENQISFDLWPEELIDLLERNPETEDFVLGYPTHTQKKTDLSSYDRAGGVPLFLQWDPQWGYTEYGSGMLAVTGCGPACLAMVGYYLTGEERFTPDRVAEFSLANNYYSYGNGSCWTLIGVGGRQLGLDVTELPLDQFQIEQNLEAGNPIICVMGPGDFTTAGHFIVLAGIRDGKITVNDPNSRINSGRLWTYEEIQDQIDNLWVVKYFE